MRDSGNTEREREREREKRSGGEGGRAVVGEGERFCRVRTTVMS